MDDVAPGPTFGWCLSRSHHQQARGYHITPICFLDFLSISIDDFLLNSHCDSRRWLTLLVPVAAMNPAITNLAVSLGAMQSAYAP